MEGSGGVSYQLFETYYAKAKEAEGVGHIKEAKKMYLMAGEALLKAAREVSGEMKAAMIRRADKIQRIADSLEADEECDGPQSRLSQSAPKNISPEDNDQTVWKSSGKPDIRFEDIAGLEDVKEVIQRRIILPRRHQEVYQAFRRKVNGGILLYGPPGTGKTMMAKAIAGEIDMEFFSIRCSDIVGKYFGEAEKNVRSLFETARAAKSAILFFDEFEALAAKRGSDSGVMNRLVPELLSQMDGFSEAEDSDILFLAATNRPWDLDSAFLRPPRLTNKIYVGLPDYEARLFLVRKSLDQVPCSPEIRAEYLAELTEGFNAADVAAFCETLKDGAIDRTIAQGKQGEIVMEDVRQTVQKVHSSVRKEDVEQLKQWEMSLL